MNKYFLRSVSGLVFLFLVFLPHYLWAKMEIIDKILVVVEDRIITQSALDEAFEPIKKRIDESGYSKEEKKDITERYRAETLDQLVDQTITDIAVERADIRVTDQEVDDAINQTRTNYNLTPEEFEQALTKEGLTLDLYKKQLRGQMLRSRLINYEIRSKIVITDAEVADYYNKHPDKFLAQRNYRLARIFIPMSEDMTAKQREAQSLKMAKVLQRLQAGESFGDIANEVNPDGFSGSGGELGWVDANSLAPIIVTTLAPLKAGDVSTVLQSSQGLQILKILDIAAQGQRPFDEVSGEISEELYKEAVDNRLEQWFTEFRNKIHIRYLE